MRETRSRRVRQLCRQQRLIGVVLRMRDAPLVVCVIPRVSEKDREPLRGVEVIVHDAVVKEQNVNYRLRLVIVGVLGLVNGTLLAQGVEPNSPGASPGLQSLSLTPAYVFGPGFTGGTVTLTSPAPPGGTSVAISSNSGALSFPSVVTVAQGATTSSFQIQSAQVSQSYTRLMSATLNGTQRNALIKIHPGIFVVETNPPTVTGGDTTGGVVALWGAAPPGGVTVQIGDNSGSINTPASVFIGGGTPHGFFTITTSQVGSDHVRLVQATLGGVTKLAYLTLKAGPRLATFSISPSSVKGGTSAGGHAVLSAPVPAGEVRSVFFTDNSDFVSTPPKIDLDGGESEINFFVSTSPVTATYNRHVIATQGGVSRLATITLTP